MLQAKEFDGLPSNVIHGMEKRTDCRKCLESNWIQHQGAMKS